MPRQPTQPPSRRQFLALAAVGVPAVRGAHIALGAAAAPGDTTPAQIAIGAGRVVWNIPPGVRGFNFWGTRSDTAFMPEYQKIGVNLLRFPPGADGDLQDLDAGLIDDSAKVAKALSGD